MKTRQRALLLAATLFTVPVLAHAAHHGGEGRGPMMEDCPQGQQRGLHQGYHGKRHDGGKQMDPVRFEQHLVQRMEKLATPELKAQFIATQQARLVMIEQQMKLHRLMAEHNASALEDGELKTATLEKIAADDKLKQQKLRLMREALGKLEN